MKYLFLAYGEESKFNGLSESEARRIVKDTVAYSDDLEKTGQCIASNPLASVKSAATLRLSGGRVTVTDGPFAETKEQLGGYFLIEARDLNDAIRIASTNPLLQIGSIEVRPIHTLCLGSDEPEMQIAIPHQIPV